MANLSEIGDKKIIGGFVGNKRIMEEFIYVDKIVLSVNTNNLPYSILIDSSDYESLGFVNISEYFTINSINANTRTLNFDYFLHLRYNGVGTPTNYWWVVFTSSNYTYSDLVPIFFDNIEGWYYMDIPIYSASATYTTSEWENIIEYNVTQEKRVIYQHTLYSWQKTNESTYNFMLDNIDDLYSKYPPCEIYKDKIVKVTFTDVISKMWTEISPTISWKNIPVSEAKFPLVFSAQSGSNPPHSTYLPPATNYIVGKCAVVRDNTLNTKYYVVDDGSPSIVVHSSYVEPFFGFLPMAFDYPIDTIGKVIGTTGLTAYFKVELSGVGVDYSYYKCVKN